MDDIPLSAQFWVLALLVLCSGFFSMAETAMMASNRHRLRHLAKEGNPGAALAVTLLGTTDKLLGVILLGNTLLNAAAAMITGNIALTLFGEEKWALEAGAIFVTFCLLVFAEFTPKVVGATHPDWLAQRIVFVLAPLLRITYPLVWAVNLLVTGLLKLLCLQPKPGHQELRMSAEELRSLVLESAHGIPNQHRAILLNLFDLEDITVEDIMRPRGSVEAIDLQAPLEEIRQQLATSYHTHLPVYDGDPGNVIGILHQRRLLSHVMAGEWNHDTLRQQLADPYFIPAGTQIYSQLQFFQENRQRLGLVVDEYGEIQGLVTLEDIIEEIIGKFATGLPGTDNELHWSADNTVLVEGRKPLREINRSLDLDLPLDGPKTLNGLMLEYFQDIPEAGISAKIGGIVMEVVQTQDKAVKIIRLSRPE
ncbi:MAG: CNNM domain-containing protein [Georgfuchsia sp.]